MVKVEQSEMTLEDFMQLYSDEGPFELIDGERIALAPQITRSGRIGFRLARTLADHVEKHGLGEIFTEVPFIIATEKRGRWVKGARVPDVMFIGAERLAALAQEVPDWESKPMLLVPDLAVEVVSPTDRFSDVLKKVERYLSDGVRLVWVIDPAERIIIAYEQGSDQQTRLAGKSVLSGGEVIPGFEVALEVLFK